MDNNENKNRSSKELEKMALEKLDMAGKHQDIAREISESDINSATSSEKKDDVKTENHNNVTDEKQTSDENKTTDNTKSQKDKALEEKQEQEELKSLISNAIQNKKILETSQKKSDTVPKKSDSSRNFPKKSDSVNHPKKKTSNAKKKTGIALGIVGILVVLVFVFIICMFFYYTGLLNRNGDNSKNYNSMPKDSSNYKDGDDTFDTKKREEELKNQLAKNATKLSDDSVYNVLLIGEDVRDPNDTGRGNTDVMMIISLNTKNKTITLTSLMRDMWVYLDEFNTNSKLNAAYWHGGSEYLEQVIEHYFGIEINRYVSVNFQSFIQIVEAVGGLDFDIQENEAEAMKDPLDEVNDIMHIKRGTGYVKAGQQHLDGYQSLAYSRIRYNCGDDYGRTQRQRAVISQIIEKSKKLSLLQINDLLQKVLTQITTDIPDGEIAEMLYHSFEYMKYDIQQVQIPTLGYFTEDIISNEAVLSPDYEANAQILQKIIYGDAKTAEEATSEYENELTGGTSQQTTGY